MERKIEKVKSEKELSVLSSYHKNKMDEFQWERICHLIVTMFVGIFFFGVMIISFVIDNFFAAAFLSLAGLMVLGLFFAYIYHYFKLENSLRGAYKMDEVFLEKSAKK